MEDGHHILKKLVKDQVEVCKQHEKLKNPRITIDLGFSLSKLFSLAYVQLKNPRITTGLGLSLLNLSSLAHTIDLDDDSIYNDKHNSSSNSHECVHSNNL